MNCRRVSSSVGIVILFAALTATPSFAGPPLLCHPFDIGDARSLPWDGSHSWFEGDARFDVSTLVGQTEALLTPSTPVIVRMETLRRAAIYASADRETAARLLSTLTGRARASEHSAHPDALAFLDAAYLTEAYREIGLLDHMPQFRERAASIRALVAGADAYALIGKTLALRPGDPGVDFAAALIAADSHRDAYLLHARKARAGASRDALLARNIGHIS
jgi:hypothetical protein